MNKRDAFKRAGQSLKGWWWSELSRAMRRIVRRRARRKLKAEARREQAK